MSLWKGPHHLTFPQTLNDLLTILPASLGWPLSGLPQTAVTPSGQSGPLFCIGHQLLPPPPVLSVDCAQTHYPCTLSSLEGHLSTPGPSHSSVEPWPLVKSLRKTDSNCWLWKHRNLPQLHTQLSSHPVTLGGWPKQVGTSSLDHHHSA